MKNNKKILQRIATLLSIIFVANIIYANDLSKVQFTIGRSDVEKDRFVIEDKEYLKRVGKVHTKKFYAYEVDKENNEGNYIYFDVTGNERKMNIDMEVLPNKIVWNKKHLVYDKETPLNYDMFYGIDVSRHNGNINWKKVKEAGFDFAFVRIVYRGYGKAGRLMQDENGVRNLKNAKKNGIKIGAYVFSQAVNDEEALEEAKFAVSILKNEKIELDLPLVYDIETIRDNIARTDDVDGSVFTNNAITFCEHVKNMGLTPAIYSNMVWQDYYFDMKKLNDYEIWYADYREYPQSPYHFTYWQFSESGKVSGVTDNGGYVDLNVRFVEKN